MMVQYIWFLFNTCLLKLCALFPVYEIQAIKTRSQWWWNKMLFTQQHVVLKGGTLHLPILLDTGYLPSPLLFLLRKNPIFLGISTIPSFSPCSWGDTDPNLISILSLMSLRAILSWLAVVGSPVDIQASRYVNKTIYMLFKPIWVGLSMVQSRKCSEPPI